MNKKVKNLSLVLFFVYLFSFNVYADWLPLQLEETNEKDVFLMSMEETPGLELWHYSGGYWSDGVITIDDSVDVTEPEDLENAINTQIEFKLPLPIEVRNEIYKGSSIKMKIDTLDDSLPITDLFYLDGSKEMPMYKIDNNYLYIKAVPKFHYSKKEYKELVTFDVDKTIPIVNPKYGVNRYAIWSQSGNSIGPAEGFYNPSNPYVNGIHMGILGKIHPSQIADANGNLKSDFDVDVINDDFTLSTYVSDDVKIGNGTFNNAGAVSMFFWYPVKFEFYKQIPDISVVDINLSTITAGETATAIITINNDLDTNMRAKYETTVEFVHGDYRLPLAESRSNSNTFIYGEKEYTTRNFTIPEEGQIIVTTQINEDKTLMETNYENNYMQKVFDIVPNPDSEPLPTYVCDHHDIMWKESVVDTYTYREVSGYHEDYSPIYTTVHAPCFHTVTYTATLDIESNSTPDELKSGYGIEMDLKNNVVVSGSSTRGQCGKSYANRTPSKTITPPTNVVVTLPWDEVKYRNTETQPKIHEMELAEQGSLFSRFIPKINPISRIDARKYYTNVNMKGTGDNPEEHEFYIKVEGGGVSGIAEWCVRLTEKLTINGDMYEDDVTSHDGR